MTFVASYTYAPKIALFAFFSREWALCHAAGGGRFFITFILCFLWFCASAFVFRLFNFPFAPPTKEPSFLSWFSCTGAQHEGSGRGMWEGGCWSGRDVRAASICVRLAWVVLWLKLFGFHCSSVVAWEGGGVEERSAGRDCREGVQGRWKRI